MPGQPSLRALAFALLLIAWCLSPRQASGQDTPSANSDSLHGTVVNSVTREPLARALVCSPDNRFAAMTDDQGRFEFTFPQAVAGNATNAASAGLVISGGIGRMQLNGLNRPSMLIARKPGFLTGESYQLQNPPLGAETQDVTISLVPEALIVGRVVLPTSEPPDKITVELYRRQVQNGYGHWVSAETTATKSNGEFRFSGLPAGDYKLLTHELMDRDPQIFSPGGQPYGYAPVYFPNVTDFVSASTIPLAVGKTFQAELTLVRQPYYPVRVAVANVPPGIFLEVLVWVQGRRGPGYALDYDPGGQAIEGMLPNGTYTLEVAGSAQGAVSGRLNITVHGAAFAASGMTVVPSRPISVDVKEEFTSPDNTVSVQMITGKRAFSPRGPRRYLSVTLEPADDFGQNQGGSLRPPSGPQDDALAIDNVQPGRYWVRINSSRGYASSVTSGGTDLLHEPLVVGPGGSSSPIEVTMRDDTAELEGAIEGAPSTSLASYTPFAYAYCVPLPDSAGQFAEAGVSPDGKFTLPGLAPGVYRVLAFKRALADFEYRNPEAMRAYDTKGQVVRLVGGQKEYLRLQSVSTSE